MFGFNKKLFPVGIDLSSSALKAAQLGLDRKNLYLHSAEIANCPDDIKPGSSDWQRWALTAVKECFSKGKFGGKSIMASIPSEYVFVEQVKVDTKASCDVAKAALDKIAKKLPFAVTDAMAESVVTGVSEDGSENEVLVMAAEKSTVSRQLAVYEKAGFIIKGITAWPLAMNNSFVKFFARRESDKKLIAMLIDVDASHSKVVICRQSEMLFARLIPIGLKQFALPDMVTKLVTETDACCRYLESLCSGQKVQRLVFFAGKGVDESICEKISRLAERMQVPAQIGDVLAAVDIGSGCDISVDRRRCRVDWSTAFGLSLAE